MTRGLIAFGTGIASCMGTIALAFCPGGLTRIGGIMAVTSIATTAIGLGVAKLCKEENQTLDKRDLIVIGVAGVVGSLLGGAAMAISAYLPAYLMVSAVSQALTPMRQLQPISLRVSRLSC
jgi:hypothetical protein